MSKRILFLVFLMIYCCTGLLAKEKGELPSLIVFDIVPEEGVKKGVSNLLTEMVMVEIGKLNKFKVIGQKDLDKMLFWETNKTLKNCTESSCLMQIAGAMGAEYYVEGSIGVVGDKYIVTIKLMDSLKASVINRLGEAVSRDENVMLDTIIRMARELMKPLVGEDVIKKAEDAGGKKGVAEKGKESAGDNVADKGGDGTGLMIAGRGYYETVSGGGSYDVSLGYRINRYAELSVGFGVLQYLGIKPRAIINFNPQSDFVFYGLLQGSIVFTKDMSYGFGGGVGAKYRVSRLIDILLEVPLEYYFKLPENQDKLRVLLTGGLKVNF